MNFTGAEIPAWGMFALATVYIAFQFILKWQDRQADKVNERAPRLADMLLDHDRSLKATAIQLASITDALGGVTNLLAALSEAIGKVSSQTDELHEIHLGRNALDSDNRPKWWTDREALGRITLLMEDMSRRMARMESEICGTRRRQDSVREIPRLGGDGNRER